MTTGVWAVLALIAGVSVAVVTGGITGVGFAVSALIAFMAIAVFTVVVVIAPRDPDDVRSE